MNKTKDILYAIFMGLILFVAGAIILGGVSYLIDTFIGFDFISIILFFLLSIYLTKLVMRGIGTRSKFYSIILPIYVVLMYILKDYVAIFVIYISAGVPFKSLLLIMPYYMWLSIVSTFTITSVSGIFDFIIGILMFIVEILIAGAGAYQSYKITKNIN